MPDEYDAFGRKKDDAGLSDLGWGATGDTPLEQASVSANPNPNPDPSPTTPPRTFQTVTPVPTGLGTPRRRPGVALIQLAVLAVIAGAVALVVMSGKDAVDSARTTLDGFKSATGSDGTTATIDEGDGTVPKQVRADSFFTTKGLRDGLRILAKEQPGKITNFSFRKDRINVQVNRGGKSHNVQMSAGAEAPEEFSASDASRSSISTISYEEISAGSMARLLSGANSRLNASTKQVDYFVVSKPTGTLQWGIYYKNSKIALGDSRGRFVRRIS